MHILALILVSVFIISIISLIGIFTIMLREKFLDRALPLLIGCATGTLLGVAFLDLIPEAQGEGSNPDIYTYVLLGIVTFFILERFIFWHHCHDGKCDVHTFSYLNLIGDGIHNFIDGMIVTAAYLTSVSLGMVTTIAIITHEIPQEIGDFSILVYGGIERFRALFYNFLSAVTAFFGAIIAFFFSSYIENSIVFLLAFASGSFIYIATSDLMPELQKEMDLKRSLAQLASFITGILLIWVLTILFE